ncbi:MAG: hypothetical protein HMLKMBBP_00619 [Planctomycetes bacterium]|nr:hypothetical protein [Planctomycetota bacterium]
MRGKRPTVNSRRAHTAGRKPGSVSREHDERMDQQTRLRLAGWRAADMTGPVCARRGADPVALPAACHRPAESAARAPIARVACDGAGVPAVAVADLLRVSGAAVSKSRLRGRALRPARGWSFVHVLSWRAPGC